MLPQELFSSLCKKVFEILFCIQMTFINIRRIYVLLSDLLTPLNLIGKNKVYVKKLII